MGTEHAGQEMDSIASDHSQPLLPLTTKNNGQSRIEIPLQSKYITQTLQKWWCCTCRVRVIGVIALLLLQVLILLLYLSSSGYYFANFKYSFGWEMHNKTLGSGSLAYDSGLRSLSTTTRLNTILNIEVKTIHDDLDSADVMASDAFDYTMVSMTTTLSTTTTTIASTTTANLPKTITTSTKSATTTTKPSTVKTTRKSTTAFPRTTSQPKMTSSTASDGSILPVCPPEPPNLQGRLNISFDKPPNTFEQTKLDNPLLTEGGHGKPPMCIARHKIAIIIPYRDRVEHLRYFTQMMHPTLQRQQVDYEIFIINQLGHGKFNRAKLMNVGFVEAQKLYPFQCFAFHDVDLILEDDRSLYWCSDRPRHMSAGVDKFNYHLPYASIFGGVTLLNKEQMESINGFSNEFWGWGGEDDDVFNRLKIKKYNIIRYPMEIARYKMIRHKREKGNEPNPKRFEQIRKTHLTYEKDGLNSIEYKVYSIDFQPTYTNITVDLMRSV